MQPPGMRRLPVHAPTSLLPRLPSSVMGIPEYPNSALMRSTSPTECAGERTLGELMKPLRYRLTARTCTRASEDVSGGGDRRRGICTHHVCLLLNRVVVVDDANAAQQCHRNGHFGLGDGVHGRANQGRGQGDPPGQPARDINLVHTKVNVPCACSRCEGGGPAGAGMRARLPTVGTSLPGNMIMSSYVNAMGIVVASNTRSALYPSAPSTGARRSATMPSMIAGLCCT